MFLKRFFYVFKHPAKEIFLRILPDVVKHPGNGTHPIAQTEYSTPSKIEQNQPANICGLSNNKLE